MKVNATQKRIFLQALVGACLFLLNCTTDKVAWDLTEYVNQEILNIAELEKRSLERYAAARETSVMTDQGFCNVIKKEVIPEYRRFLDLLRQIQPETAEVRRLHYLYVCGSESIYRGLKIKAHGLENNDVLLIQAGNEEIEKGRKLNEKWRSDLSTLDEAHRTGWKIDLWGRQ